MRRSLCHALTCIVLAAPGAALADSASLQILPRPANCNALMTVQLHGCQGMTVLNCKTDSGEFWRTENFREFGLINLSHENLDGTLFVFATANNSGGYFSDPSATHNTPIDQVAKSGSGDIAMAGTLDMLGAQKPMSAVGTMTLLTPPLVMNGVTFQRIARDATIEWPRPMPIFHTKSVIYFDPVSGVFFQGEGEQLSPATDDEISHTPAAIILPGEPGFDQPHPTYDCGDLSFLHSDIKAYQA